MVGIMGPGLELTHAASVEGTAELAARRRPFVVTCRSGIRRAVDKQILLFTTPAFMLSAQVHGPCAGGRGEERQWDDEPRLPAQPVTNRFRQGQRPGHEGEYRRTLQSGLLADAQTPGPVRSLATIAMVWRSLTGSPCGRAGASAGKALRDRRRLLVLWGRLGAMREGSRRPRRGRARRGRTSSRPGHPRPPDRGARPRPSSTRRSRPMTAAGAQRRNRGLDPGARP